MIDKFFENLFNDGDFNDWLSSFSNTKGLGEPTEINTIKKGGIEYEEKIWDTKDGYVRKLVIKQTENLDTVETLQKELDLAVEEMRYEDAVILRDKIKVLQSSKQ